MADWLGWALQVTLIVAALCLYYVIGRWFYRGEVTFDTTELLLTPKRVSGRASPVQART